ncbi:MAG: hypothetical protein EBX42_11590 [Betaproteobacteria bacterium]|nr:hypothetical protein [Betaproteobacteria bacterium]
MKVLFHTHTLSFRGTAVAVYDYARYNEEVLGNESVIAYNKGIPYEKDMGTEQESLDKTLSRFEVRSLTKQNEIDSLCYDVDLAYFIRAGHPEPLPTNTKTGVHCVFQHNKPHGDVYAYISDWLSRKMTNGVSPFVPHIVSLPEPTGDYREKFNLKGKTVIGRFGGFYKFDIMFVRRAIKEVLEKDPDIAFLFVNTMPFMQHERVIFLGSVVDLQKKSNYINTCDGFIHARQEGESFGLALCESLFFNKPTLSWNGGRDQHHIQLLKGTELLYDETNIVEKLLSIKDFKGDYKSIVEKFNPTDVMNKFKEVFIEG